MGDRAMAEIITGEGSLYVYTHWCGSELPENAKEAIRFAQNRWDDTPYAIRILVDQLTKGGRDRETGYGLMLVPDAEDEYNSDKPSVIIDLVGKKLIVLRDGEEKTSSFQEV